MESFHAIHAGIQDLGAALLKYALSFHHVVNQVVTSMDDIVMRDLSFLFFWAMRTARA